MDEFDDPTLPLEEALEDTQRIDYHYDHLYYLQKAIQYVPSNKICTLKQNISIIKKYYINKRNL
jgi:hypothetical protein